jgi:hypothetical protein
VRLLPFRCPARGPCVRRTPALLSALGIALTAAVSVAVLALRGGRGAVVRDTGSDDVLGYLGAGTLLGTTIALLSAPTWRELMGDTFSSYAIRRETAALGAAAGCLVAVLGALPPAIRLARARPLDVLRLEG